MSHSLAVSAALLLSGCGIFVPRKAPWSFVTAVGGIAVDQPTVEGRTLVLPVRADVSGTRAIAVKPTTLNSALFCPKTYARAKGHDILLSISTGLMAGGNPSAACPPARLRLLPAGKYSVYYGSTREGAVPIGEITVVR